MRQGVWASLTRDWSFDPHQSTFGSTQRWFSLGWKCVDVRMRPNASSFWILFP